MKIIFCQRNWIELVLVRTVKSGEMVLWSTRTARDFAQVLCATLGALFVNMYMVPAKCGHKLLYCDFRWVLHGTVRYIRL